MPLLLPFQKATIASAVSTVAEKLADLPVIGVAARATSMAAGYGAKVLKFFGFSKPIQLEPAIFAKVVALSNSATLENKDTAFKLTADPKQELSIQPLGGESNIDPMSLKFLTSRESYFHTFSWSSGDDPLIDTLSQFPVTPMICSNFDLPAPSHNNIHQMTSLAFATLPFENWRGTISFRFEVIASSFHRGKLLFVYEPNLPGMALIGAAPTNLNQQYVYCLDIEEDRDVTIDCGFVFDRMFAQTFYSLTADANIPNFQYNSTDQTRLDACSALFSAIGVLYVRPFTRLTSPSENATGDVRVNVYVHSDDIEFAKPRSMDFIEPNRVIPDLGSGRSISAITSESEPATLPPDGAKIKKMGPAYKTVCKRHLINRCKPTNEDIYLYHFGEKIESFRALLKRDETIARVTVSGTSNVVEIRHPLYPCIYLPSVPAYINATNVNTSVYTPEEQGLPCLFDHLRYAYLFCKGGYRIRVFNALKNGNVNPTFKPVATVTRDRGDPFVRVHVPPNPHTLKLLGSAYYDAYNATGIEYEMPFYSNDLFVF